MRQHHKWIVKWFLCNTLLWQHSPMSGKQVSIKRVDLSIGKLASVWPMAFHCVSGHALALSARMRFASNSLYHTKSHTIAKKVKHKNGLDSFPIGRRLRECFPYTLVVNMRSSLATILRGKNSVAMLCGDFAEWVFPAPAVWLQNSKLGLDHFALGRASVQPTNRLCAVTLAQINKSVCLQTSPATIAATVGGEVYTCSRHAASRIGNVQKSQFAFVWITMWLTRKRCKSPAGMKYIRMTSLHRRRSHPVAARKGIWFIFATSAQAGRAFRSQNNSFATPYFGNTAPYLANRCRLNVLTCRLESWLQSGLWHFIVSPAPLSHWARECGLHQTLFITPKVIQSKGVWNTKTALANSQSEGGWGCFPYTLVVNMRASLATILRGKNNVAMSCGDFAAWEFPAPAVWLQNSELGSNHFGRASVQPTSILSAVTLAQINKSVCLQTSPASIAATVGGEVYTCSRDSASRIGNVPKSQFAFVWITMW